MATSERTIATGAAQSLRPRYALGWAGYAGLAYTRAGRGKAIAAAHLIDVSGGTRYRQGVTYSPLAKALAFLAEAPRTTAWPALTEAWITVTRAEIAQSTVEQLGARRAALEVDEIDLNRDIAHARLTGESMRALRARQMDMAAELAAIEDELSERKGGAR